jgi:hypothetical protein
MPRAWKLSGSDGDRVAFDCPGCGSCHAIPVSGPKAWTWNGSLELPTFSPSIRASWTWGPENVPACCHSHVTDGRIAFCSDSTHALAGKTVDLPEVLE